MSDETLDMLVRGAIAAAITAIREAVLDAPKAHWNRPMVTYEAEERCQNTVRLLQVVADELGIEVGGSALLQEAQQLLDRKRAEQATYEN